VLLRSRRATLASLLLCLLSQVVLAAVVRARGADLGAVKRLLGDPSPSARAAALRRLAGDDSAAAVALLRSALADASPYVRRASAGILGQVLDASRRKALGKQLRRDKRVVVRAEACRVFALWADAQGTTALASSLADRAPDVRRAAVRWYAELLHAGADPSARALQPLLACVEDADAGVRAEALAHLPPASTGFPARERVVLLRERLSDADAYVRVAALEGSVAVSGETAAFAVLRGLTDAVWSVRLAAAELARAVPDRRVLQALVSLLDDARARVRAAAHRSLVLLTGIPFEPLAQRWRAWLETDGKDFDLAGYASSPEAARRKKRRFESGTDTVATARFMGLPIDSDHVAFVLDASSSMRESTRDGETRWSIVLASLRSALRALRAGGRVHVNVHLFAEQVESLFRRAERLTPARANQIEKRLAASAPRGKTALYDGIAAALADPVVDLIVVLSDGAPSAGAFFTKTDLLTEIRLLNRWHRARIDVVAIGTDGIARRWRNVLRTIASDSGGRYVERR